MQSGIKPNAPHILDQRVAVLRQLNQLSRIPSSELWILAEQSVLHVFEPWTTIIVERSEAHYLFLLLDGQAEQSMRNSSSAPIMLARCEPGYVFGEGGLFGQRQRRTTVRSQTYATVLQWNYQELEIQKDLLPQTFRLLRDIYRDHLLYTTLAQVPQLALLDAEQRTIIAQQVQEYRFDRESEIVRAGSTREGLYILAEGQVRVIYADHTVAVLNPGTVFGEMSFIDDAPHEATIIALTPVHILKLSASLCEQLLVEHPLVFQQLCALAEERRSSDRSPIHIAVTEQLVETGIARGNMVLAKQNDLCSPGCHRCEEACGDRFGVSRLHCSGTSFGDLEVPDSCRHCQWGAECAEACPVDAFSINETGHLVITDRCTGCGACIEACPYDAINQIPMYPEPRNSFDWFRFTLQTPQATGLKANKCDACNGYTDYACVNACPTGALHWVPIEQLYRAAEHTSPAVEHPTTRHNEKSI